MKVDLARHWKDFDVTVKVDPQTAMTSLISLSEADDECIKGNQMQACDLLRKAKGTATGGNEAEVAIRALVINAFITGLQDRALCTKVRNMSEKSKTMADMLARITTRKKQMYEDNADLEANGAKVEQLEPKELGAALIRGTATPSMKARMVEILGQSFLSLRHPTGPMWSMQEHHGRSSQHIQPPSIHLRRTPRSSSNTINRNTPPHHTIISNSIIS